MTKAMNIALFFDTETTGLPLYDQPSDDPRQPHIVQLGALLVDLDSRRELSCIDVIVKPDDWTIPDDVAAIHGISTEHAMDAGIPESMAVDMLLALWANRTRIGHNESFDARIIRIALKRFVDPRNPDATTPMSDQWKAGVSECTQRVATPLLTTHRKAKGLKGKTCSLAEAHELLLGRPIEHAHSAIADARSCMDVYFAIKDGKTVTPG